MGNLKERLAIIDHETHTLWVEDVPEEILEGKYNGEEEAYIRDNYSFATDEGAWSWEWITDSYFVPDNCDGDCMDLGEAIDNMYDE